MTIRNLTCNALDGALADYLEGALSDSELADVELHLSGCTRCAALVRDLESITRRAAALPAFAPSRDLWPEISGRIEAPVLALAPGRAARTAAWRRIRVGAAAAGLVGITALVTYTLTRQHASSPTLAESGTPTSGAAGPPNAPATAGGEATAMPIPAPPVLGSSAAPRQPALVTEPLHGVTPVARRERVDARSTYDSEISRLRGVVSQRADQLDPATVAIIENSLKTIDTAIAEARNALSRDPASRFLSGQLNKALEKKLGLLRTAALLPART